MAKLKAFTMPKWGIEMSEGSVAEWMVEPGKLFAKGDVLTLIETDKITNEIEAEEDGCLVRLIAEAGETFPVGALLGVMGPADADAAEIDAFVEAFAPIDASMVGDEDEKPGASPSATPKKPEAPEFSEDILISPAAWAAAKERGIDVKAITGSGRGGRITFQDVARAQAGGGNVVLKGPITVEGQDRAFASPLARRIAVQNGIDLAGVTGTGHRGRIGKVDVVALLDTAAAPTPVARSVPSGGESEILPMSSMRRTIARRLTDAKQTIPHFYLRRRVRADRLIALRERQGKPGSVNDYLVRAAALALCEVPEVNIQVHGDAVHRFVHADIAVAVTTPRGLITPIVTGADERDVAGIAAHLGELAQRARAGKLRPEEYQGGSFSLSNLGMFGVEQFDAIINPPQGAILAVGKARPEPIDDSGAIRIVPVMHLSLSCDHRAIDGADGGRFLEALSALIEAPERL